MIHFSDYGVGVQELQVWRGLISRSYANNITNSLETLRQIQ